MINSASEFIRFIICGIINTLLTYLIYLGGLCMVGYSLAYTFSFICGIFISYYLNSRFVFQKALSWRKALQYPLVYLLQYVLGISSLYLLVEILGLSEIIAPVIVVFITVPATFLLSRRVIGKPGRESAQGDLYS